MTRRAKASDKRRKRRRNAGPTARAKAKPKKSNGTAAPNANGSSEFVTRAEVNEAFQTYAQNLGKLGQVFNENQTALRTAFELVDAHQAVMRRISEDHMWNRVRPKPLHPDDEAFFAGSPSWEEQKRHAFLQTWGQVIDYEWYFHQYNLTRCVIMMGEGIRKFLGLNEKQEQPTPEPPPEDEFQFGGDYEPNQIHGNPG